ILLCLGRGRASHFLLAFRMSTKSACVDPRRSAKDPASALAAAPRKASQGPDVNICKSIVCILLMTGAASADSEDPPVRGDCYTSVTNFVRVGVTSFPKWGVSGDRVLQLRESVMELCRNEKWSKDVLLCIAVSKSGDDLR